MRNKIAVFVKNQLYWFCAWTLWVIFVFAILQKWPLHGTEPPGLAWVMIVLVSIPFVIYFLCGRRLVVDLESGQITKNLVLMGVSCMRRDSKVTAKHLFIIPEYISYGYDYRYSRRNWLYYNVCLGEYRSDNQEGAAEAVAIRETIKPECISFILAERYLRKMARRMNLPASVCWDLLYDKCPPETKSSGDLRAPFHMPKMIKKFLIDRAMGRNRDHGPVT